MIEMQTFHIAGEEGQRMVFDGWLLGSTVFRLIPSNPWFRMEVSICKRHDGKYVWAQKANLGKNEIHRMNLVLDNWRQVNTVYRDLYQFFKDEHGNGIGTYYSVMMRILLDNCIESEALLISEVEAEETTQCCVLSA